MVMLIYKLAVLFVLVLSLSFLLNTRSWIAFTKDVITTPIKGIPFSLIMLAMGLIVVLSSNSLMPDYTIWITFTGWLMLFYGVIMLLYPGLIELFEDTTDDVIKRNLFIAGTTLSAISGAMIYKLFL